MSVRECMWFVFDHAEFSEHLCHDLSMWGCNNAFAHDRAAPDTRNEAFPRYILREISKNESGIWVRRLGHTPGGSTCLWDRLGESGLVSLRHSGSKRECHFLTKFIRELLSSFIQCKVLKYCSIWYVLHCLSIESIRVLCKYYKTLNASDAAWHT